MACRCAGYNAMKHLSKILLMQFSIGFLAIALTACSNGADDGYLSPPIDSQSKADALKGARSSLASATYESVGKPFGCESDCKDEELGFAEARQDGITKSEDCTTQFSEKSLMTNATQDGCRAYVQAYNAARESLNP